MRCALMMAMMCGTVVWAGGCRNAQGPDERPDTWAAPIEQPGLPNFHRVGDGLYRSAQPTAEGLAAFAALGGRTVINLRGSDTDRPAIDATDLHYIHMPLSAFTVDLDDVRAFLILATDPRRQPILLHCQHGADRTGLMVAAYRVVVDDWTKEEAIAEMTTGGFDYSPFWSRLPKLIEQMNVDAMRAAIP